MYLEALPTPGKMVYLMQVCTTDLSSIYLYFCLQFYYLFFLTFCLLIQENSPNRMSDGNFDVQMNLDRLQEENRQRYNLYKPKVIPISSESVLPSLMHS